ncbi:MAG: (Fe-S)-binding protein [Deltaproteobacteria bacterium]|nr:(Fe-S)-binding protein [Deltaproteobacteria bacterium]
MRVHLFIPCLVDQFRPEAGLGALRVLESLGIDVDYTPEQICCGQPFYKSGRIREAARLARKTLSHYCDGRPVVSPSGSCVRMIRHDYETLFAGDPHLLEEARDLASRSYELSEFLVRVLGETGLGAAFPGTVTFHDSCQVRRGLGIWKEPRRLLERVAGLELREMNRSGECCGFGGVFSAKHPEVAGAIARDKLENALATGASWITGCEISCLLHLERQARCLGAPIRTLHLAEILAGR